MKIDAFGFTTAVSLAVCVTNMPFDVAIVDEAVTKKMVLDFLARKGSKLLFLDGVNQLSKVDLKNLGSARLFVCDKIELLAFDKRFRIVDAHKNDAGVYEMSKLTIMMVEQIVSGNLIDTEKEAPKEVTSVPVTVRMGSSKVGDAKPKKEIGSSRKPTMFKCLTDVSRLVVNEKRANKLKDMLVKAAIGQKSLDSKKYLAKLMLKFQKSGVPDDKASKIIALVRELAPQYTKTNKKCSGLSPSSAEFLRIVKKSGLNMISLRMVMKRAEALSKKDDSPVRKKPVTTKKQMKTGTRAKLGKKA